MFENIKKMTGTAIIAQQTHSKVLDVEENQEFQLKLLAEDVDMLKKSETDDPDLPDDDPFAKVLKKSICNNDGSLKAYIIYPYECTSFQLAVRKKIWNLALRDDEGDFYLMGTYSLGDVRSAKYEHAWRDKGDNNKTFYAGEDPIQSLSKGFIKGHFENEVIESRWQKIHRDNVVLKKCGKHYKLPIDFDLFLQQPTAVTPLQQGNRKDQAITTDPLLSYLLYDLAVEVRSGDINTQQNTLHIWASGAIVETDRDGFTRILVSATGHSMKGGGIIHAEEIVLSGLHKKLELAKEKRTDASKLGLMMVIVHARGEQGGSMCSSCVCALAKFVAASGLDPTMLHVKFPTRLSRRLHDQKWVSPFTAFRDVVLNKLQVLEEIEFKDCAMNDHGTRIDANTKQVGQKVSIIVKEILENQKDHWTHCGYSSSPHNFETDRQITLQSLVWELSPEGRQRLQRILKDLDHQHEQPNHASALLKEGPEGSQKAFSRSDVLDGKRSKDFDQHETPNHGSALLEEGTGSSEESDPTNKKRLAEEHEQPNHASALLEEGSEYSQESYRPSKNRLAEEELSIFKTKSTRKRKRHATDPKEKDKSHQNRTREVVPDRIPAGTMFTKGFEGLGTFQRRVAMALRNTMLSGMKMAPRKTAPVCVDGAVTVAEE
jgi:hypothetical protein